MAEIDSWSIWGSKDSTEPEPTQSGKVKVIALRPLVKSGLSAEISFAHQKTLLNSSDKPPKCMPTGVTSRGRKVGARVAKVEIKDGQGKHRYGDIKAMLRGQTGNCGSKDKSRELIHQLRDKRTTPGAIIGDKINTDKAHITSGNHKG